MSGCHSIMITSCNQSQTEGLLLYNVIVNRILNMYVQDRCDPAY